MNKQMVPVVIVLFILSLIGIKYTDKEVKEEKCKEERRDMVEYYLKYNSDIETPFGQADNLQKSRRLNYLELRLNYAECLK